MGEGIWKASTQTRRRPLIVRSIRRGSARRGIVFLWNWVPEENRESEKMKSSSLLFSPREMPKLFLVTGANRGVGLEIAARLVHDHSCDVILACRRREACEAAVAEIDDWRRRTLSTSTSASASPSPFPSASPPCARAAPLPLDLSSPRSVFEFVEALKKEEEGGLRKFDGIVLNAGISPSLPSLSSSESASPSSSSFPLLPLPAPFPAGWSPDSVDEALATNHVGHFALIRGLLEIQKVKEGARVVAVSSRASAAGKFEKEGESKSKTLSALAPRLSSPFQSYSRSKLANVLFCRELARRSNGGRGKRGEEEEEEEDALSLSVAASSPGLVRTPLARGFALSAASSAVPSWLPLRGAAVSALSFVAERVSAVLGQSPAQGATSSLFAATADEEILFPSPSSDRFAFVHGKKRADWLLSTQARDGELAKEMWEATEAVVAEAKKVWESER